MQNKRVLQSVLFLSALPLSAALGQYDINFTSAEGYIDGQLTGVGADANSDWAATGAASAFVVDSTAGTLTIDAQTAGGNDAAFEGSTFTTLQTITSTFTLTFRDGYRANGSGPHWYEMGTKNAAGDYTAFYVRLAGDNAFDVQVRSTIDGTLSVDGAAINISTIGLTSRVGTALDPDPGRPFVWDGDQTSQRLQLVGEYAKVGADYVATATLTNLDTSTELGSATQTIAGASALYDTFLAADKTGFISPAQFTNFNALPGSITVDSFTVAVPEPSAFALLAGLGALGMLAAKRRL